MCESEQCHYDKTMNQMRNSQTSLLLTSLMICCQFMFSCMPNCCLFKDQGDRVGRVKSKTFSAVRKRLVQICEIEFDNTSDTLFTIDFYDLESGKYRSKIFGKKDNINYSYHARQFDFQDSLYVNDSILKIITKWDTVSLRHLSLNDQNYDTFYVQRIVVANRKCQTDQFRFAMNWFLNW